MDLKELDRLFDESMGRVGPLSGTYSNSPLAADHSLLQRSWEYFRRRLKDIDEHWKKILQAKESQLDSLSKELEQGRGRINELEDAAGLYQAFEVELKKSRADDFEKFRKETEQLRFRWEEERDALVRTQSKSEAQIKERDERLGALQEEWASREKRYIESLEQLGKELSLQVQKNLENQNARTVDLNHKEEECKNLYVKIDVLRAEIDRRDQLIKELREEIAGKNLDLSKAVSRLSEVSGQLKDREDQISLLNKNLALLSTEKNTLRELWSREQAEWRELWDRERENWDRRSPARNENVDIE